MKKLIKSSFILILFLSVACNENVGIIDNQETQELPDNVESLTLISSGNEQLNVFLKNSNMNKQELYLDEVSLLKFKGDEGKYAFTIPMDKLDKQSSKTLMVYFKDSDFTKFKATIHAVETSIDENNIEHQVITISEYGKTSSVKIEFVDGRLISSEKYNIGRVTNIVDCTPTSFNILDSNGNFELTPSEISKSPVILAYNNFNSLDTNADETIDYAEFLAISCSRTCLLCNLDKYNNCESGVACLVAIELECLFNCWNF